MNDTTTRLFDQTNGVIDLDVEATRLDAMTDDERSAAAVAAE